MNKGREDKSPMAKFIFNRTNDKNINGSMNVCQV